MAARYPLPPVLVAPARLQRVLATAGDSHARQRELVRASLFCCPEGGRGRRPRAA